jgi:glucose 1-dehydrogenase
MDNGRCIVVTGAESGIGAACAAAFGANGDKVAVLYFKDEDAAQNTVKGVMAGGGHGISVQCEVDDEASVEAAYRAVEKAYGPACVLVNSAGINMSGVTVADMPLATWQRMLATDLTGAFLMSRRFLKARRGQAGASAMVHISSIHAEVVRAGGADYCSAKGGLTRLVETMAIEEAANDIRVNAIEPGMILTPMNDRAVKDEDYRARLEQSIPMKRAGRPEEVAKLALWLASEDASYITGATIKIDGGLALQLGIGA